MTAPAFWGVEPFVSTTWQKICSRPSSRASISVRKTSRMVVFEGRCNREWTTRSGYRVGRELEMQLQTPAGGGVEPQCPRELDVGDNPLAFAQHPPWWSPSEEGLAVGLESDQAEPPLEFDGADDGGERHERVAGVFRIDEGFARKDDPF